MNHVRTVASLALLSVASAHAAEAPQNSSTPASAQLEEVTVTAQRRSENMQDVPIAVQAVTDSQMQATGIETTVQLIDIVPALTYSNTVGLGQLHIRGIGNTSQGAGVENSVATYIDGVYIAEVPGSLLDVSNVDRVEVLKGPQGTLFGRNATGGLMQIVTKDPGDHFSGNASVNIGNYDTVGGKVYLNGPITPILGADLMVSATRQGTGYGENVGTGNPNYQTPRDFAGRSKWVLKPNDTTTVRLSADYENWYTIMTPTIIAGTAPAANGVIQYPTSPYNGNFNADPFIRTDAGGLGLKIDQEIGPLTLDSITSYRAMNFKLSFDADFSPVPKTIEAYYEKDTQISQEFQLSPTHAGALQWVVGFFYFHWDSEFDPFQLIVGAPPALTYTNNRDLVTTKSYAAFGQATYEILPKTNLTVGIRYTQDQRTLTGTLGSVALDGTSTTKPINQPELTTHVPTWRLSLDHKFDNDLMAYISYNRGYKSGGYIATSPTTPSYKPEYLDAYEIGEKSQWLDNRLRLNLAAFLYNYKDIQVNSLLGSIGIIYNGAKAREYGIDFDADFKVAENFSLTSSVLWNHDRFTSFPNAVIARPVAGGLVSNTLGSAEGNELPFAPTASVTLGFDYRIGLSSAGSADVVLNDLYSTGFYGQVDNYLRQPAYHMMNGSVNWKPTSGNFNVMLWGNNLLSRNVATYLQAAVAQQIVQYQPPRTYGVRFGWQF